MYKANIDDTRESPSFELIELLKAGGAEVEYCDPHFPEVPRTRQAFGGFDVVLIATAHDQFKDRSLWSGLPLVVDTRNLITPLFQDATVPGPKRLVKA